MERLFGKPIGPTVNLPSVLYSFCEALTDSFESFNWTTCSTDRSNFVYIYVITEHFDCSVTKYVTTERLYQAWVSTLVSYILTHVVKNVRNANCHFSRNPQYWIGPSLSLIIYLRKTQINWILLLKLFLSTIQIYKYYRGI